MDSYKNTFSCLCLAIANNHFFCCFIYMVQNLTVMTLASETDEIFFLFPISKITEEKYLLVQLGSGTHL